MSPEVQLLAAFVLGYLCGSIPFGLILTFGYDKAGNRETIQDSKGGVTTVVFDVLNRQSSEQLGGSGVGQTRFDYAYNARGERTSEVRFSDTAGTTRVGTVTYDHDADEGFSGQNYWPEEMEPRDFYEPTDRGFEARVRERLAYWEERRKELQQSADEEG